MQPTPRESSSPKAESPKSISFQTLFFAAILLAGILLSRAAMSAIRPFTLNKQIFNPAFYARIQSFWFADHPADATAPSDQSQKNWFYNPDKEEKAAFDTQCSAEALHALDAINSSAYPIARLSSYSAETAQAAAIVAPFLSTIDPAASDPSTAASNALSLILLCDQFSRNIFRTNQGAIYGHYDFLARAFVRNILAATPRLDTLPLLRYDIPHRIWLYMPLMHSEHLEDHALWTKLNDEMLADAKTQGKDEAAKFLEEQKGFEAKHVSILKQFGRYPYRNEALGRETTKEEKEWLEGGGETFGT